MNAKKVKAIRKALRAIGVAVGQVEYKSDGMNCRTITERVNANNVTARDFHYAGTQSLKATCVRAKYLKAKRAAA